jgi:hypothetical protein
LSWIEAVVGIKVRVMMDQIRLRIVQMAEVVLGWELRTTCVQQSPHLLLNLGELMTLSDNVVLVKDVAEKMTVIELMKNATIYFFR